VAEDKADATGPDISQYNHRVEVKMPDMGADVGVATVQKYYFGEGEAIKRGKNMCDISLEAFTFSMDNDDEGISIMGEIHIGEGETIPGPGAPLFTLLQKIEE